MSHRRLNPNTDDVPLLIGVREIGQVVTRGIEGAGQVGLRTVGRVLRESRRIGDEGAELRNGFLSRIR